MKQGYGVVKRVGRSQRPRGEQRSFMLAAGGVVILLAIALFGVLLARRNGTLALRVRGSDFTVSSAEEPLVRPGLLFTFPTPQIRLQETNSAEVYMPTTSGRLESAFFGTTRTGNQGGRLVPRFHKAIDISPTQRDVHGRPLDDIFAVAEGEVVYVNRAAGGSSYGCYVVLTHDDPVGPVYSLYAHLALVAESIRPGVHVACGQVLGRMGHSAPYRIPLAHAHLHFEIGVVLNSRFGAWYAALKGKQSHGNWNGLNLFGIDPLSILLFLAPDGRGSVREALAQTPSAFTVLLAQKKRFDYFHRYPDLQAPDSVTVDALIVEVSEGGVPLHARAATEAELATGKPPRVLAVDENVLGRNGQGLIRRQGAGWRFTERGLDWIALLAY